MTRRAFNAGGFLDCARYLAGAFAWWLTVFALFRLVFLALNWSAFPDKLAAARGFLAAFPLDASMAGWFCLFSWMALLGENMLATRSFWLHRTLTLGFLFLYGFIATGEAAAYGEWKSKLNYKAASAVINHPGELLAITRPVEFIAFGLLWLGLASAAGHAWLRKVEPLLPARAPRKLAPMIRAIAGSFLLVIPVGLITRGGVQAIPVSMASVYYSSTQACNDLAVNPGWNMFFQIANSWAALRHGNPFDFMPVNEAREIVRDLHRDAPDYAGVNLLTSHRPNVVLIILESWSGDMVTSITRGPAEFTPEFRKLESGGVLFTRFYANGNRSQQGITSVLAGFPALGFVAAADDLGFVARLPGLARVLAGNGYDSSFMYGGQLEYGNIRAVVTSVGFGKIRAGEENFPSGLKRGAMGVHDGEIVDEVIRECDGLREPFFLTQFTLSSHAPYDQPGAGTVDFGPANAGMRETRYAESIRYTDAAIGKFFATAATRPWFKNTLFILVADHGHNSWRNLDSWQPDFRRIPLLFTGPVIKQEFKGRKIDTLGSQVDLPATLLGQLRLPAKDFAWSRDMLEDHENRFVQYEQNEGFGFITDKGVIVYNRGAGRPSLSTMPADDEGRALRHGMAYTQCSMQTFIDGTWCGESTAKQRAEHLLHETHN